MPPSAGFFGKLYIFDTAIQSNLAWLAAIGVINSVISAVYYLRPIRAMFIDAPADDAAPDGPSFWPNPALTFTLGLTAAGILVIGLVPSLLIDVAEEAVAVILT